MKTGTIDDWRLRLIREAQAYMKQHGLSLRAMAQICGMSEYPLRINNGITSPDWNPTLKTLAMIEAGMRENPAPIPPRPGPRKKTSGDEASPPEQ